MATIAVSDLLRLALMEIRVARAGDVPSPNDLADTLLIFNALLDRLNISDRAIFTRNFQTVTLTPSLQPHTIGASGGTFTVSVGRPAQILAAELVLSGTILRPLTIRDDQWWQNERAPAITSAIPTDLYYSPDWVPGTDLGAIYLWPIPTTAYSMRLWMNVLLAQVTATTTIDLPFGYQQMLYLSLAELLGSAWGQQVSAETHQNARTARAAVFGQNDVILNATPVDGGMPSSPMRGGFDYRSGYSISGPTN